MCFYMPLLQSCLGGTPFGARSSGPDSCGIGMPKSIWLHHRSHTCASTCLCYKVAWGHSVRGPKFGARLLWHSYAKKHLITSSEFTYMCFYMPLLQSCLGALCSGPEVRGPTLVAQVCQKPFDYIMRVHIHVLLHAFATKLPGGNLFGARSSGPDSCGTGMPKNIWLHHQNSHTCASTYLPLLQSCLGAPRSGPEVRGPTLVA